MTQLKKILLIISGRKNIFLRIKFPIHYFTNKDQRRFLIIIKGLVKEIFFKIDFIETLKENNTESNTNYLLHYMKFNYIIKVGFLVILCVHSLKKILEISFYL